MTAMAGQVAIVSGGTRGIGLALTRRLCRLGYRVVAFYRTDHEAAKSAATVATEAVQVDVSDPDAVRRACDRVVDGYGPPRVLVNNAGINVDRPFLDLTVDDWTRVLATNLSGPFHVIRALAPAMLSAGGGTIVNIGATTAVRPRRNGANYCASKAGLLQLTRCLALELAPTVRVNCLVPGYTDTPELVERYRLDEPDRLAAVLDQIPLRRMGTGEDVADALEFLVSDRSRYLTGQQLVVDGGNVMG